MVPDVRFVTRRKSSLNLLVPTRGDRVFCAAHKHRRSFATFLFGPRWLRPDRIPATSIDCADTFGELTDDNDGCFGQFGPLFPTVS